MVDQEVVDILEAIKQQVRAGEEPASAPSSTPQWSNNPTLSPVERATPRPLITSSFSGLTTLGRSWDRLPPLVSNRSGTAARVELWIKSRFKRALRWITWEQVNFNAATHQTFREVIETLSNYERYLLQLHQQLEQQRAEVNVELQGVKSQFEKFETQLAQLRNQLAALETQGSKLQLRVGELLAELRDRDQRLLDEQRVCFKQLSFEAGEALVMQDRARRQLESRLAKLEQGKD